VIRASFVLLLALAALPAQAQRVRPTVADRLAAATTGVFDIAPGTHVIPGRIYVRGARDLQIRGNGATFRTPDGTVTTAPFIELIGCQRVTISDLVMIDTDPALHVGVFEETHGIIVTDSTDVRIENVTIQDVGDEAVNFVRSRRCSIRHSTIRGAVAISQSRAGAITVTNSHEILIESNWIYDTRQHDAIRIETQNAGSATAITIRGNIVATSPIGVRINDFGGSTSGVVVADNIFRAVGQPIVELNGTTNARIHDNVILGN
jgi:hypothetical protein